MNRARIKVCAFLVRTKLALPGERGLRLRTDLLNRVIRNATEIPSAIRIWNETLPPFRLFQIQNKDSFDVTCLLRRYIV